MLGIIYVKPSFGDKDSQAGVNAAARHTQMHDICIYAHSGVLLKQLSASIEH